MRGCPPVATIRSPAAEVALSRPGSRLQPILARLSGAPLSTLVRDWIISLYDWLVGEHWRKTFVFLSPQTRSTGALTEHTNV
jgi:hypothetical protein